MPPLHVPAVEAKGGRSVSYFRQHLENMQVRQAKLHHDPPETGWYITASNGTPIRGPFLNREQAQDALERRRRHYEENPEEAA